MLCVYILAIRDTRLHDVLNDAFVEERHSSGFLSLVVERALRKGEVEGSIPLGSKIFANFAPVPSPDARNRWRTSRLDTLTLVRVVPLSELVARRPLRRRMPPFIFFFFFGHTSLPNVGTRSFMFVVGADEPGILAGRMALRTWPLPEVEFAACHRRGHRGLRSSRLSLRAVADTGGQRERASRGVEKEGAAQVPRDAQECRTFFPQLNYTD